MTLENIAPAFRSGAFVCPMCDTQAMQSWHDVWVGHFGENDFRKKQENYAEVTCFGCKRNAMWHRGHSGERMIWPVATQGPPPNDDLSEDVRALYEEARAVEGISPRSAAALLRTATEMLLREQLDDSKAHLSTAIGTLVKDQRLSPDIQRAADLLRLTGNDAVHPSSIQLEGDDAATGLSLFDLLNLVADELVTRPKRIAAMYEALPESKRQHIDDRDKKPTMET